MTDQIARRLPVSFELGFLAMLMALLIAIPVGVFSAVRQDSWGDYVARSVAVGSIAIPTFWLATVVMVFPSVWWKWSPAMRWIPFLENPGAHLVQIMIPAIILGMATSGQIMRIAYHDAIGDRAMTTGMPHGELVWGIPAEPSRKRRWRS